MLVIEVSINHDYSTSITLPYFISSLQPSLSIIYQLATLFTANFYLLMTRLMSSILNNYKRERLQNDSEN